MQACLQQEQRRTLDAQAVDTAGGAVVLRAFLKAERRDWRALGGLGD